MSLRRRLSIAIVLGVGVGVHWLWGKILEANPEYARSLRPSPGFMSSRSADTTPIKVKLGNKYYAIPAQYFDAPLGDREGDRLVIHKEGDIYLESGVLLVGYTPDFGPRQKAWDWEEALTRDIHVLIDRPGFPPATAFANIREGHLFTDPELVPGSVSETETIRSGAHHSAGAGLRRVLEEKRLDPALIDKAVRESDIEDFFEDKATGFFVTCNRIGGGVRDPHCDSYSHDGNLMFEITFRRKFLNDREQIRQAVLARLKSWEFEPTGKAHHDGE